MYTQEDIEIIEELIRHKAESHGFELTKNVTAIAKAKARFFGLEQWTRCPCDRESDRACCSAHCLEDIEKNGVCHCNLYKKKGD